MICKLIDLNPGMSKDGNYGEIINSDPHLEMTFYHVLQGATLKVSFESEKDFLKNPCVVYQVLDGQVEVIESGSTSVIGKGQMIVLHPRHNFMVVAKEESNIICITNDGGGNLDLDHIELDDAIKVAEQNDPYVLGHNYRVSRYAILLMQAINPALNTDKLRLAAGFHDVGKAKLDPRILNKEGKLTDAEFKHIQSHPIHSYELLKDKADDKIANIARWHHEKLDGTGYPDGLKEKDIQIESQVIAVADMFDALTSKRCYRDAFSFAKALAILSEDANKGKINKDAVNALKQLIDQGTIVDGVDNQLRLNDKQD